MSSVLKLALGMAPRRAPGYDRKSGESNRRTTLLCRRATRQKAKVGAQGEQVRDERSQSRGLGGFAGC